MQSAGGIKGLLIQAVSIFGTAEIMEYLEEKRRTKEKEEVSRKRKEVVDEIDELKTRSVPNVISQN